MSHWMQLIMESPIGWMSMLVILFTIVITVYLTVMFWKKSAEPEQHDHQ